MKHQEGKRGHYWPWIAGVLGVGLGIALGGWQLQRAAYKERIHAAVQAQAALAPLQAAGVQALLAQADVTALLHRNVALEGRWLPEHTVYLDNRQMQGKPGFYVLTPLLLNSGAAVLVQRGWVARNFQTRHTLQPVQTPRGWVHVAGTLAGGPARLYALQAEEVVDANNPLIRQNLDLTAFAHATGLSLWPLMVQQSGSPSDGLRRDWPQIQTGVATHYGYAFQWFAIAAVLAGMLLWFQWWQPLREARTHVIPPCG